MQERQLDELIAAIRGQERTIWLARRDMREGFALVARAILMVGHKQLESYRDQSQATYVDAGYEACESFRDLLTEYARGDFRGGEGSDPQRRTGQS
jgi:hypothetical protein